MKTPSWAIFVGIMMILVGGCGALQDVQSIVGSKILDVNEEYIDEIDSEINEDIVDPTLIDSLENVNTDFPEEEEEEEEEDDDDDDDDEMMDSLSMDSVSLESTKGHDKFPEDIKELLNISDHYKTWILRFGYIGLFFSLMYAVCGVFIIARQKFSLKLAYGVLGACILFALIQIYVLTMGEKSMFTLASSAAVGAGMLFDIIFLIIIVSCDTTAYEPESFT